eukprot:27797-Eustigmatos_ZCMA.PRE.1
MIRSSVGYVEDTLLRTPPSDRFRSDDSFELLEPDGYCRETFRHAHLLPKAALSPGPCVYHGSLHGS